MPWIKSYDPKIHGIEKRSVYPLSLLFSKGNTAHGKHLFKNFHYKDIIPFETPKKGRVYKNNTGKYKGRVKVIRKKVRTLRRENSRFLDKGFSVFIPDEEYKLKWETKKIDPRKLNINSFDVDRSYYTDRFKCFKSDVRDLPSSIFSFTMNLILEGLIYNKFSFRLPNGYGRISMQQADSEPVITGMLNRLPEFKFRDSNYMMFVPQIEFYTKESRATRKPIHSSVLYLSRHLNYPLVRELKKGHNFNTTKEVTIGHLMKNIQLKYYDVPKEFIQKVLEYGFKRLRVFVKYKLPISFYQYRYNNGKVSFSSIRTSYGLGFSKLDINYNNIRHLLRHYHKYKRWYYSGFFYTALSDYELKNIKHYVIPDKRLYASIDEAMMSPVKYPNIIGVKIPFREGIHNIFEIKRNINYAQDSIEFIWRWDGKRFRTTNYSQYSFDRPFKRNFNHVQRE